MTSRAAPVPSGQRMSVPLLVILGFLASALVDVACPRYFHEAAESPSFVVADGYLAATEMDADQGYFTVGQASMVALRRDTPGWLRMKGLLPKTNHMLEPTEVVTVEVSVRVVSRVAVTK